jgi:carboxyl-terminal processing protease
MKKKTAFLGFTIFVTLVLFISIPQRIIQAGQQAYNKWMILTMIIDKIERFYVDEKSSDELFENAIHGILAGLDPHSVYLSSSEYADWKKKFEGYQGLGISYRIIEDRLVVISLIDEGPAMEAGIRLGDRIVEVAGKRVSNMTSDEIQRILSGSIGSLVELKIERDDSTEPLVFRMPLRQVQVESIPCALMLNDSTGYIKIGHFTDSTPTELDLAFAKLNAMDMKQWILDLRNNSGGMLGAAIEVADRLLTSGKLIVFTKGRAIHSSEQYMSTDENTLPIKPLIVLVNEGTASDAEIVAGAVQDWDRGLIVGQKTYGKALVQTEYLFQDGSALLLTTARYYTPLGRLIQKDYFPNNGTENQMSDKGKNGTASTNKKFRTPRGRVVYGGGGISPDIAYQPEAEKLPETFQKIYLSKDQFFYKFADQFVREHPESIPQDLAQFARTFEVKDEMINEFRRQLLQGGIEMSIKEIHDIRDLIRFALKREIASRMWADEGRYMINVLRDDEVRQSVLYFNQAKRLVAVPVKH